MSSKEGRKELMRKMAREEDNFSSFDDRNERHLRGTQRKKEDISFRRPSSIRSPSS